MALARFFWLRCLPRLAGVALALPSLLAAQPAAVTTEHVRAELLAHAPDGVAPGRTVWLGLAIQHQPHWHTYWKNPGDSGLPTSLAWQLPAGASAGDIAWPTPQALKIGPLMNHGYEGALLLPVPIAIGPAFQGRALRATLRAEWLVCKEICVPESGEFTLDVPAQAATAVHAARFDEALARVPRELDSVRAGATIDRRMLNIEVDGLPPASRDRELRFFAEMGGVVDHAAVIGQRWQGERWVAQVPLSLQRSESPAVLHAVLVPAGQDTGIRVRLPITGSWADAATAPLASADTGTAAPLGASLVVTLGLALLGGLLLNLMPCVFPVLSLKVLGFARPDARRRTLALGGLAYSAGVIVSFVALAALLVALRAGGEQLGWGFQLQSPTFVALLALLFTLIGLNLAGVFSFGSVLPAGLATLRARHPMADHALTGALAVAVASPCTGPFMGVALGAALTLPAPQTLLVFAALGIGMALPYLAASLLPGVAHRLPRPGAWMARFKVLMAFPMFATVVWLLWVLGQQAGIDAAAGVLAIGVALAFVAWALGTPEFGRRGRIGFGAAALLVLAGTVAWAWPALHGEPRGTQAHTDADAPWQPWSPSALAQARSSGRPVFVDFTAAWCVTCQLNKRSTLQRDAVMQDFERRGVVLLRADWTRRDALIAQELARLGRSGVPVYALYAPAAAQPLLLPEILSSDIVRRALAELPTAAALGALVPARAGAGVFPSMASTKE